MAGPYPHILRAEDAGLCYRNDGRYLFAREQSFIPISLQEVQALVSITPLVLARREAGWHLLALMAIPGAGNMLIGPKGAWLGAVVPERLALHPLTLVNDEADGEPKLAQVAKSQRLGTEQGEPLIDEQGKPTQLYQSLTATLRRQIKSDLHLGQLAQLLMDNQLLRELPQTDSAGTARTLYGAKTATLQDLAPEIVAELVARGSMALLYALQYSAGNMKQFMKRQKMQEGMPRKEQAADNAQSWSFDEEAAGFNFDI